jgi:DNA-binding response OmpR family regulator
VPKRRDSSESNDSSGAARRPRSIGRSPALTIRSAGIHHRSRQIAGKPIDLMQREFQILELLMRHKDRVVTRTMLLEQIWDYRFDPHTGLIDTHISRLRKKIDGDGQRPLLHTLRNIGYRLSEQD